MIAGAKLFCRVRLYVATNREFRQMAVLSIAPRFAVVALSIASYLVERYSKQASIITDPVDTISYPRGCPAVLFATTSEKPFFISILGHCDLKSAL